MSVRRCQQEVDGVEFLEWLEYWRQEPWGEERADHRAGVISAVIANVNRGKNSPMFRPADFMPRWGQTEASPAPTSGSRSASRSGSTGQTPEQMWSIFAAFGAAQNNTVPVVNGQEKV
jgi:hypothetical protein